MYKKITHHIVEEHFDHPIAAELKRKVEKNKVEPKAKAFIHSYDLSPLSQYEKDSLNYWGQLAWRISSLVVSITEGDKNIDVLKERMAGDINNIAKIVEDCYGTDAAKAFSKLLNDITLALVEVLILVKEDRDTTKAMSHLADTNKALGNFLEKASKLWPSDVVVDIFGQIENLYIMQAISRIKKEWAPGIAAADDAYNIIAVHQDGGGKSFADIFSAGIRDCLEKKIATEITQDLDYMET